MQCYYWLVGGPETDEQGHEYFGVVRHFVWGDRGWDDDGHPASGVWRDFCCAEWDVDMEEEWEDYFPTLDAAKGFQARFQKYGYSFVIIAIYPCESAENVAEAQKLPGFLGLDVANTDFESVLSIGALWKDFGPYEGPLDALWAIGPKYARLRLNRYGLLSNYEDAALLRDVGRAMEKLVERHETIQRLQIMAIQQVPE